MTFAPSFVILEALEAARHLVPDTQSATSARLPISPGGPGPNEPDVSGSMQGDRSLPFHTRSPP
jgi:hypothetical protein